MAQEHLGLFDTPPARRDVRLALLVVVLLLAVFLPIIPIGGSHVGEVAAFVPVIDAVVCIGDLIIATLLYAQAAIFRSRALTLLASGFVFCALFLIPHALTFPGAFAPDGLFDAGPNATAWAMVFRRLGFPLTIILYLVIGRADQATPAGTERSSLHVRGWLAGAIGLAAALSTLAIAGIDLLPPMFVNNSQGNYSNLTIFNLVNIALVLAAMAALFASRKSVLDLWLLVALAGWLIQSLLNLSLQDRFTLGWYSLFLAVLVSHTFLMLALLTESSRLYTRLALSKAAYNRERDRHFMTVSAMAATFSHEIGQPLAAVTTNAAAGLSWLDRDPPETGRAVEALRAVLDGVHRTNNVAKGLRALIADENHEIDEFDINDLARQTALSLERELAADSVSLNFELRAEVPPVRADRGQLQQVLLNLLFNAIESLRETTDRARRITLRSAPLDGGGALLEVRDTGDGIAASPIERIFEPFMTTKSAGMGIGLSICRNIVEEYGGKLWASNDEPYGATFHLQLPGREAAA